MQSNPTQIRLEQAFEASGLTQAELARRSGIDRGSISLYLSGRYRPKADKLIRLASALTVSPEWLLSLIHISPEQPVELLHPLLALLRSVPGEPGGELGGQPQAGQPVRRLHLPLPQRLLGRPLVQLRHSLAVFRLGLAPGCLQIFRPALLQSGGLLPLPVGPGGLQSPIQMCIRDSG